MESRRTFLIGAGGAVANRAVARGASANDQIRIAVLGVHGRGQDHIQGFQALPDAAVVAMCDPDANVLADSAAKFEKRYNRKVHTEQDLRRIFDNKEIDAVSVATPNHWHALAMIWACQAGKDVYVEKPACYNVFEGQKMIEAADKYKRMVQVGSQSRSIDYKIKAIQMVHNGAIGKVYLAKGLCYKRRKSIGHTPEQPVPPGINWDIFLGPAPMRPFTMNRYKYNWHWFWETGNGDIGNQGVHEMDLARWALNKDALPNSVVSTGGKFAYDDDQE